MVSLTPEILGHHTLAEVIKWGLLQSPQLIVEDVVVQDEFTHDVVFPYRDGHFLVYDTT